jgi:3-methyladenine DNA glycosylase/8-oxoguanine DNA glycosylase
MTDQEFDKQIEAIDQQRRDELITWDEVEAKKRELKTARGAVVYIAINEDADYEVGATEDEATERLNDNVGGRLGRLVRLTVRMSPPKAEDGGEVRIADTAGVTMTFEAA